MGGFFGYNLYMRSSIKTKWIIKTGPKSKVKCKVGDVVEAGQVVLIEGTDVIKSYDASVVLSKLNKDKIESLNINWKNKEIKTGDVVCETGGLVNKKVFAPIDGVFCGIDEFFNMTIKIEEKDKKIVCAPVQSLVSECDKEKLVLEFKASEIKGKGIVQGRVWGNADFVEYNKLSDLDYNCDGKVIMAGNTETTFITKAEVVGVVGMIIKEEKEIEADIPILMINPDDWDNLLKMGKDKTLYRVLLNAKLDRLLIVK
jgi:hypothetical protein